MSSITTIVIASIAATVLVGGGMYGIVSSTEAEETPTTPEPTRSPLSAGATHEPTTVPPSPLPPGVTSSPSIATPVTSSPSPQPPSAPLPKYNFVFMIADDFNTDIKGYGKEFMSTPNLDALIDNGVRLTSAHSQLAVCSPSRNSFMTGILPETDNCLTFVTTPNSSRTTITSVFKKAGYTTYATGKIYHKNGASNVDPDYEKVMDDWIDEFDESYLTHPGVGECPPCTNSRTTMCGKKVTANGGGSGGGGGCRIKNGEINDYMQDKKITTWAEEKLPVAQEPFMMMVGFTKPHAPFLFRDADLEHYTKANDVPPVQKCFTSENIITWTMDLTLYNPNGFTYSKAKETQNHQKDCANAYQASSDGAIQCRRFYRSSVSYMDMNVGKVVAAIGDKIDRTIVIFTSDHGYLMGNNNMWAKKANVFQATNVPFIVQHPDMDNTKHRGTFNDELFGLIDLFPTMVGFANRRLRAGGEAEIAIPNEVQGFDLSHLFFNDPGYKRSSVSHVYPAAYWGDTKKANGDPIFKTGPDLWDAQRKNANQAYLDDIVYMARNVITKEYRYTKWTRFDGSEPGERIALYDYTLEARQDPVNFELFSLSNDPEYQSVMDAYAPYLLNPETPQNPWTVV